MVISILHRITGSLLALVGIPLAIWWLASIAAGAETYAEFAELTNSFVGTAILIVLTWAFFMHLLSGLRHFVMDIGAGLELDTNKKWALTVMALAPLLTGAFWLLLVVT